MQNSALGSLGKRVIAWIVIAAVAILAIKLIIGAVFGLVTMIFTLAPTITMDVFKSLSDVRRGELFDARAFTATHIELRRGNEVVALDKSKGKDDKEIWKKADGKEVDATKADDLLNRVLGLRASSFDTAAPASLKTPQLAVTVRYDENKTETVTFARDGADVVAARSDEPGAARVMASTFDDAIKALDAVK